MSRPYTVEIEGRGVFYIVGQTNEHTGELSRGPEYLLAETPGGSPVSVCHRPPEDVRRVFSCGRWHTYRDFAASQEVSA